MEIQNWLPLLITRKEIIISHIERFYPPNPESSKDMIIVMDKNGKTYNRKPRATDKENIINGELFLIYIPSDNLDEEEFSDESIEYDDRDAALQSIADFCNFNEIPSIYDNMLATAQKSKSIAEYLKASFSENK